MTNTLKNTFSSVNILLYSMNTPENGVFTYFKIYEEFLKNNDTDLIQGQSFLNKLWGKLVTCI